MTAEQLKAHELIKKFMPYIVGNYETTMFMLAKQCAIICVDEVILSNPHSNPFNTELYSTMEFWQTVRKEIVNYKI